MHNHLYIIPFLLLGISCTSAPKPVATIHGHAFHLGDSLTIGLPHDNDPSEIYKALSWSQEDMEIPAFAKGELKIHIKPFKMNVFGERINEPDTVYFLSLPQYPKDSLIIDLKEAVERGEILTEPIREDKTLYPEAVELRPSDYIVALIKIGTLTYTDEVIQVYAKNLKDRAQTSDDIDDPREFQRQRATLLAKLKAAVEKFDLDRVYYLRHKVITRGYDSKRSGYAWEPGVDGPLPQPYIVGEEAIRPHFFTEKKVPFISVPRDRAERFEKRTDTQGMGMQAFYVKSYIRIVPGRFYVADQPPIYIIPVNYLGLDAYEYPHCAYYHLGSSKAVEVPYHP